MGGRRERARRRGGFSSLMKQKKRGKIALSFASPEKEFFIYIYDVITWEEILKRATIHYFSALTSVRPDLVPWTQRSCVLSMRATQVVDGIGARSIFHPAWGLLVVVWWGSCLST
jgi:hypothetical protein